QTKITEVLTSDRNSEHISHSRKHSVEKVEQRTKQELQTRNMQQAFPTPKIHT
ncbi:hypothetical protein L9F63_018303, partial [Diploptera punctata]